MRRPRVLHPLLFAIYPVLFLYAHNVDYVRFPTILRPLAAVLLLALAAWGLTRRLVRNPPTAGLVTSAFLLCFFSFGQVMDLITHRSADRAFSPAEPWLALGWLVVFAVVAAVLVEFRGELRVATNLLNLLSAGLLLVALVQILPYEWHRPHAPRLGPTDTAKVTVPQDRPDIYYIILDRYARGDNLERFLGFDNRPFLEALRRKGFYVAERSRANYVRTFQSLSSSLNMSYLDPVVKVAGARNRDQTPLYDLLRDHAVRRFLKARGYRYYHMGSDFDPTRVNPLADVNLRRPGIRFSEFDRILAEMTLLRPLLARHSLVGGTERRRATLLYQFDELARAPRLPGPKFVFAHVLSPHMPYVFDAQGGWLTDGKARSYRLYLGQLEYTNTRVLSILDHLLADSSRPPIIILQSDEGAVLQLGGQDQWGRADDYTGSAEELHRGILNAYYFPCGKRKGLYPSISPVNTFRLVFNNYFGTRYPLLRDETWESTDWFRPYLLRKAEEPPVPSAQTVSGQEGRGSRPERPVAPPGPAARSR